jgi:hypothetical protein
MLSQMVCNPKRQLQGHCESMQILQSRHAFAVMKAA